MHIFTHLKPSSANKTGYGIYADGMVEHDAMVGELLNKLTDKSCNLFGEKMVLCKQL
jgi:arylsulfatase